MHPPRTPNTPLQALTLLNDPVFSNAQALGRGMVAGRADSPAEIIRRAFLGCLSREPTAEELARLTKLYDDYLSVIQKKPASFAPILGDGKIDASHMAQAASLVGVARTILNLDEFVTRE